MSCISRLGLGTGRIASIGSSLANTQAAELFRGALDAGINVIDTADAYGSGDSERLIGKSIEGRREECFLVTKAGLPYVSLPGYLSPLNQIGKKILQRTNPAKNFSRAYLLKSLARSLRRLNVSCVDAFLLHQAKVGETTEDTWRALEEIRMKGMSRFTGVSTTDPLLLQEGLVSEQVQVVESSISLVADHADEICNLCDKAKIPLIANEVLKAKDKVDGRADVWERMRRQHAVSGVSTIHLLIAYAASRPAVGSVLIGTRSPQHLLDNLEGLAYAESMRPLFAEMKEVFS